NRTTTRRPHDRGGSHRVDPGLCGGDESRDHGRRADAHRLPASDVVGDDEGSGAGCVWPRAEYLVGNFSDQEICSLHRDSACATNRCKCNYLLTTATYGAPGSVVRLSFGRLQMKKTVLTIAG